MSRLFSLIAAPPRSTLRKPICEAGMDWLLFLLYLLGALVIVVTLLPLWRTTRWWVRLWDFPKFQVALLAVAILLAWPLLGWPTGAEWVSWAQLRQRSVGR